MEGQMRGAPGVEDPTRAPAEGEPPSALPLVPRHLNLDSPLVIERILSFMNLSKNTHYEQAEFQQNILPFRGIAGRDYSRL
jgi:hypothetical protein